MPLYEYRCTACGHRFEKIQSFSAPDEKECPKCGAPVERLISAPAIQFKGSGFYLTDYAKSGSNSGKSGGESASSASKGDSSAPSKSDSSSSTSSSSGSTSGSGSGTGSSSNS